MAFQSMSQNRRQYSRLTINGEPSTIVLRGLEYECQLLEESIGGLKIGGVKLLNLVRGEPIIVSIRDEEFLGWSRNVERVGDGTFTIGIERSKGEETEASKRMLVNTYIVNEGYHFICYATSARRQDSVEVCLWDRHQLVVKGEQLVSLTEQDRQRQLGSAEYLSVVSAIYGRDPDSTLPEQILNFEF